VSQVSRYRGATREKGQEMAIAPAPDHLGIVVADIEQAEAWYCEALDCKVVLREPATDVDAALIGLPGEKVRLRGVLLETGGTRIELHQYLSPVGNGGRRVCDLGLGHIAFRSTAIEEDVERLVQLGVKSNGVPKLITKGPYRGRKWWYGVDPFGIVIELFEDPEVAA
jgi:catechol 2,3-dioxygenase-like lactoylglutathione lyase family enzyme